MLLTSVRTTNVGMGELVVSRDSADVLACIGLGSCIALCAFDPVARVAGLAHMLLPSSRSQAEAMSAPAKYINMGVPNLIARMLKNGATRNNLIVKITGGARMLHIPGDHNVLDIGQKNIAEVKAAMQRENIPILGADVGGTVGRSMQLYVESGRIVVRNLSGSTFDL